MLLRGMIGNVVELLNTVERHWRTWWVRNYLAERASAPYLSKIILPVSRRRTLFTPEREYLPSRAQTQLWFAVVGFPSRSIAATPAGVASIDYRDPASATVKKAYVAARQHLFRSSSEERNTSRACGESVCLELLG
jgi:hypothetical protein